MPQKKKAREKHWRITANVHAVLKPFVERRVVSEEYDGDAQYMLALILMDLICQMPHRIMPQLLQKPRRIVDAFIESLVEHPLGVVDPRELGGWLEKKVNQLIAESKFDPSELHIVKDDVEGAGGKGPK